MRQIIDIFFKNRDGVAALEFALIAPILALLMIGLMDFGLYINAEMKLENMARSISDYVVAGGEEENIANDILAFSYLPDSVNSIDDIVLTTATVCECDAGAAVDCADTCDAGTGYMRQFFHVDLELEYSTVFPYPGLPDTITLVGTARMQMQ